MKIKRVATAESSLVVDLFNKYRVFHHQVSDIQLAHDFIRARLENNESVIFVALNQKEDKEIPIGFTQLYPGYLSIPGIRYWILNDLFIEQGFRHHGVGESLIKTAFEFAKANGGKFVEISTTPDNFTAQKLYEKMGFEKQAPDTEFLTYRLKIE